MIKFDGNLAWKQASAAMKANRDLLLALAGVFFLLPSLAFGLFLPQPEPITGASETQILAQAQAYYLSAFPYMLLMALIQAVGTLAALTLFTDRTRPTVGQAIGQGLGSTPIYMAAQILLGIGIGVVGTSVLVLASLTGVQVVSALGIVAIVIAALYIGVKTSLVAPIVAVERQRNPLMAIRRSWQLTRGNSVRLGVFYLLLALAGVLLLAIVMGIIGIVLAVALDDATGRTIAAVFSSALGAVVALYFVAVLAAAHRQLAGPSAEAVSETFE